MNYGILHLLGNIFLGKCSVLVNFYFKRLYGYFLLPGSANKRHPLMWILADPDPQYC